MRFEPGLKLACHSELGKYLEGEFVSPINIEISPSGVCNANCSWCFYRQNNNALNGLDKNFFDESRMLDLIGELAEMGVKSISWTGGGEPTLHPSFPKFVNCAKRAGLKQGLFTNALKEINYDPTHFDWIRVSKTNKGWPVKNIKKLRGCKTLGMCINYTGGEYLIKDALKIAEELDAMKSEYVTYVQVRPALKIQGEKTIIQIPKLKHPLLLITEYKFLGSDVDRIYKNCEAYHFAPFIWQDGDVDVCSYHRKNKKFNLGNVNDPGKKGRFKFIMKNAPSSVKVLPTCQICCKLNAMNSMIYHIKKLEDRDFP